MRDRIALLSFHTCPLLQPGRGWAGGMNVYIDELARALARSGHQVDVFTRRHDRDGEESVTVEPGFVVHHIEAGPRRELGPDQSFRFVGVFADAVIDLFRAGWEPGVVHSHYWLSGWAGLKIKREAALPHVHSSHTLGRVQQAMVSSAGDHLVRVVAEQEVIGEADRIIASTEAERADLITRYQARADKVAVVAPGVDHDIFVPGSRRAARIRLGWPDVRTLLFAGRIQHVKGPDVAVEATARLRADFPDSRLIVVGGPSGRAGAREIDRIQRAVKRLALDEHVAYADPVPHRMMADVYRASDLVLVPSRSESFGLVAAEAQACGVPVVAAAVGGLASVVGEDGGGLLVRGWDSEDWATAARRVLDDPDLARKLSERGPVRAELFSWEEAVGRLLDVYDSV